MYREKWIRFWSYWAKERGWMNMNNWERCCGWGLLGLDWIFEWMNTFCVVYSRDNWEWIVVCGEREGEFVKKNWIWGFFGKRGFVFHLFSEEGIVGGGEIEWGETCVCGCVVGGGYGVCLQLVVCEWVSVEWWGELIWHGCYWLRLLTYAWVRGSVQVVLPAEL